MNSLLVLGGRELAWGRGKKALIGSGYRWDTDRLPAELTLADGTPVDLGAELEGQAACYPAGPLGVEAEVTVTPGGSVPAELLPSWSELASRQAREVTAKYQGPGLLLAPEHWKTTLPGRQLLRAWAEQGWVVLPLDAVLREQFPGQVQVVVAGQLWLRLTDPTRTLVLANGLAAARAAEAVSRVLPELFRQLDPVLVQQWTAEEEAHTGWFLRQRLLRALATASGGEAVTLDGLFRFSGPEAAERYRALATARVTITLRPAVRPTVWWLNVGQAGFLRSKQGGTIQGIDWRGMETALSKGSASDDLAEYLRSSQHAHRPVDLAQLDRAFELQEKHASWLPLTEEEPPRAGYREIGERLIAALKAGGEAPVAELAAELAPAPPVQPPPLPPVVAAAEETPEPAVEVVPVEVVPVEVEPFAGEPWPELVAAPTPVVRELPPEPPPDPLQSFAPDRVVLPLRQPPEDVRIFLDGQLVEQREPGADGKSFRIAGVVRHGAIVRVDFDLPELSEVEELVTEEAKA